MVSKNFLYSDGRNPNRIEKVLKILKETWMESPDLRLGQLICIASNDKELFSIEDDELINQLILMRKDNLKVNKNVLHSDRGENK